MGQAGAHLGTGFLDTNTSVDQLRVRLKELTHRVSGVGAFFAGQPHRIGICDRVSGRRPKCGL